MSLSPRFIPTDSVRRLNVHPLLARTPEPMSLEPTGMKQTWREAGPGSGQGRLRLIGSQGVSSGKEAQLLGSLQSKPEASQSVGSPGKAEVPTGWGPQQGAFSGLPPLNTELVWSYLEWRTQTEDPKALSPLGMENNPGQSIPKSGGCLISLGFRFLV